MMLTREEILKKYPYDVAQVLITLSPEDRQEFYALFSDQELMTFFEQLDEKDAAELIAETGERASGILSLLDSDDAADIINELPESQAEEFLENLAPAQYKEVVSLANYDENEAGSIMATNYIAVDGNKDVKDAMKVLIARAPAADIINPLFVEIGGKYYGALDLKKLIVTKSPCLVKTITNRSYPTARVHDDREKTIAKINDYDINALPVLDKGILKGSVTIDDATDVMEDEQLEDYNKLAAVSADAEAADKVLPAVWHRLPWLMILLVLDIFVCLVDSRFNALIAAFGVLAVLQPIILNLSGNVGTQALATSVRDISSGKLDTVKKGFAHVLREVRNSFSLSLCLGLISFLVTMAYAALTPSVTVAPLLLGATIGIAVLLSVTASGLFGALMPQLFALMHVDPAVASGPFITTINDMLALLVYFGVATMMLV